MRFTTRIKYLSRVNLGHVHTTRRASTISVKLMKASTLEKQFAIDENVNRDCCAANELLREIYQGFRNRANSNDV
jgi:predicted hydrolase (HD superfamily)